MNELESYIHHHFGSIQLTCAASNINCCSIGSLGEPFIGNFFNQTDIFGAGGLLIG